jgi:hypothetical protein
MRPEPRRRPAGRRGGSGWVAGTLAASLFDRSVPNERERGREVSLGWDRKQPNGITYRWQWVISRI